MNPAPIIACGSFASDLPPDNHVISLPEAASSLNFVQGLFVFEEDACKDADSWRMSILQRCRAGVIAIKKEQLRMAASQYGSALEDWGVFDSQCKLLSDDANLSSDSGGVSEQILVLEKAVTTDYTTTIHKIANLKKIHTLYKKRWDCFQTRRKRLERYAGKLEEGKTLISKSLAESTDLVLEFKIDENMGSSIKEIVNHAFVSEQNFHVETSCCFCGEGVGDIFFSPLEEGSPSSLRELADQQAKHIESCTKLQQTLQLTSPDLIRGNKKEAYGCYRECISELFNDVDKIWKDKEICTQELNYLEERARILKALPQVMMEALLEIP